MKIERLLEKLSPAVIHYRASCSWKRNTSFQIWPRLSPFVVA